MSTHTRRELIEAALKQLGYTKVPGSTNKAHTWRWPSLDAQDRLVFVGKLGSVRVGRVYSNSLAMSAGTVAKLLVKGEKALAGQVQK